MAKDRLLIALVDHNMPVVHLLSGILGGEGYQTLCCFSGKEGHGVIQREKPDLIILDIGRERRDSGLIALTALRLDPATEKVPIIIVCSTGENLLPQREEYLRAHSCEILEKPFSLNALFARVTNVIGPPHPPVVSICQAQIAARLDQHVDNIGQVDCASIPTIGSEENQNVAGKLIAV